MKDGTKLITDLVRLHRYARHRREKSLTDLISPLILRQGEEVVSRALAELEIRKSAKGEEAVTNEVLVPSDPVFWSGIIGQVFADDKDIVIEGIVRADMQSLVAQGVDKTALVMGTTLPPKFTQDVVTPLANNLARNITGINETTRLQIAKIVEGAQADGLTVRETAKLIKEKMPGIAEWRAQMIARTELANAYTMGSLEVFKRSPNLTHVSVVGCGGVDDSNHFFDGRHTCNIKMVPIERAGELRWHPNHTGTVVPAAFRKRT